jgi:NodT family efflux transporter outer membrane factor (OMF) lipoprotein
MPSVFRRPFPCSCRPFCRLGARASGASPACIAVAALLVLGGCAVGPDYQRPAVTTPQAYKEIPEGWKSAAPADGEQRGDWWRIFDDAQLDALMARLNTANQTVAGYEAAWRQARALVAEARSSLFPGVTASAGVTRSGGGVGTISTASRVGNSYSLGLDATWELDVFGGIRRQVASQRASAQAAQANLDNARLAAQAALAQDWFQLRMLDATQRLLDDTVASYERSLQITRNRYVAGVAGRADVIQAQTQLQSAQASAVDNGIARAQYEHAIALLVGANASTFSLPPAPLDAVPPQVPTGMPSALLERRPDIAAAERAMAAANEQIGVEIAAYFPTLTLGASGGFQSTSFSQWLTAPARVWSLGPQLAATVFDAGLRRARTEAARAAYDQQAAAYREAVLTAFQQVEDNLAGLRLLAQEVVLQQQAVASAEAALNIVLNQYKAGTSSYLEVITAQATAFSAEQRLSSLAGQRMVAAVGLIKALGGGWDASQLTTADSGSVDAPATPGGRPDNDTAARDSDRL